MGEASQTADELVGAVQHRWEDEVGLRASWQQGMDAVNRALRAGWPVLHTVYVQTFTPGGTEYSVSMAADPVLAVDSVQVCRVPVGGDAEDPSERYMVLPAAEWRVAGEPGAQTLHLDVIVGTGHRVRVIGRNRLEPLVNSGSTTPAPPGFVVPWALYELALREVVRTPEEAERWSPLAAAYRDEALAALALVGEEGRE